MRKTWTLELSVMVFLSLEDDKFKTSDLKFVQQSFYDDVDLYLPLISVEIKFTAKKTFSLVTLIMWSVDSTLLSIFLQKNGLALPVLTFNH